MEGRPLVVLLQKEILVSVADLIFLGPLSSGREKSGAADKKGGKQG
jgi:hypothetical protein